MSARRKKQAPPAADELVDRVNHLHLAAGADYFIAPNGDVYRTVCPLEHHLKARQSDWPMHVAKPIGNISNDPELAARLGITARSAT